MKLDKELGLFQDKDNPFWRTAVYTEDVDLHGNCVIFAQEYPHPLLGSESESVLIKEEDIDKVIEFLQSIKK